MLEECSSEFKSKVEIEHDDLIKLKEKTTHYESIDINSYNLFKKNKWLKNQINNLKKVIPDSVKRKKFVEALIHDSKYDESKDLENFQFLTYNYCYTTCDEKNKEVHKVIKEIFESLYTYFFKQLNNDMEDIEDIEDVNITKREKFYREFFSSNNDLSVCPSCLGELNLRTKQLDHYFPKSKIPVLSIHPANLVPICSTCNTSIGTLENVGKGENMPTSPDKEQYENEKGSLNKIFIPYSLSAHKKIAAKIEKSINKEEYEKIITPILVGINDMSIQTMLDKHEKTFNLKNNWSSKGANIYNILYLSAQRHFNLFIKNECNSLNPSELLVREKIEELVTEKRVRDFLFYTYVVDVESKISKIPDMLLISSYAMYLFLNSYSLSTFTKELQSELSFKSEGVVPYFYSESMYT